MVKLSISLSDEDVEELDAYARSAGLDSRSAAVQHAIKLLRVAALQDDYAAAWNEWEASGDREAWEPATPDGLSRESA